MIALALASAALAAPTVDLPDALPRSGTFLAAQVDGGAAWLPEGPLPTARLAVEGRIDATTVGASTQPWFATSATERFDRLWVKQNVYDRKRLHVAPFVHLVHHAGSQPTDRVVKLRPGVAVETGGEHLRFDASLTPLGLGWYPSRDVERGVYLLAPLDGLLPSELGVSYLPVPQVRVRVGAWGPVPLLSVDYEGEQVHAGIYGGGLGLDQAFAGLRVGFRT